MTLWIVTTGNSDVQIKNNDNWGEFYDAVRNKHPLRKCDNFRSISKDEETGLYPVPSRVLGLVYGNRASNYGDLAFPLLDELKKVFKEPSDQPLEQPTKILVLLTDQSQIFDENDEDENDEDEIGEVGCPYWQDTCTLEPIFKWYFQEQESFGIEPVFGWIKPPKSEERKGIDHWDEMLEVVKNELARGCAKLDVKADELVYVSHQAGTPAISSAVQFVSIGKFEKVKFLVSNQSYDPHEEDEIKKRKYRAKLIESSKYWRSLQIQKAKKLIEKRLPSAALELLDDIDGIEAIVTSGGKSVISELKRLVSVFNLKEIDDSTSEFEPENAIKRVRKALDLIEIFFEQENYIQGITLLAAAQETFLKAAIKKQYYKNKSLSWDKTGLKDKNQELKLNQLLFDWLDKLKDKIEAFKPNNYWYSLIWSCIHKREHDFDRRNQLMHNLRGVEKLEVIHYLLGCPKDEIISNPNPDQHNKYQDKAAQKKYEEYEKESQKIYQVYKNKKTQNKLENQDIIDVYYKYVKEPFLNTLKDLGLWDDKKQKYTSLQDELEELANYLE